MDVIIRGEMVETVQPGDRCSITGTLIVIPDIAQLSTPGLRAEPGKAGRGMEKESNQQGVTGLKSLGVRDLTYKMAFLATHIESNNTKVDFTSYSFTHSFFSLVEKTFLTKLLIRCFSGRTWETRNRRISEK